MIDTLRDTSKRDIRSEIRRINEVVSFPPAVAEILQAMSASDVTIARIATLIASDPAMTAKILHVANSPFYGLRRDVTDIPSALRMLGLDEVGHLVLTCQMKSRLLALDDAQRALLDRLWKHSLAVAVLARLIAQQGRLATDGKEYTAGLLHDMGKLVLVQYFPELYRSVETLVGTGEMDDVAAERRLILIDHMEIGRQLGEKWRLPKEYLDAMQHHHLPAASQNNAVLCAVVRGADVLAEAWDNGIGESAPHTAMPDDWFAILASASSQLEGSSPDALAVQLRGPFEEQFGHVAVMM